VFYLLESVSPPIFHQDWSLSLRSLTMAGFGFTPDDSDDAERANRENLEAMMRQMQEQIQQQFEQLGINPGAAGFPLSGLGALFSGSQETLPLAPVRDTAKKFIASQGSQPLGTNDVTAVNNACEIADIWLNEATDFPATSSSATRAISRLDWIDETLPGWQATMEPLASGLSTAISKLLDEAMKTQGSEQEGAMAAAPIGAIAGLLRSFIGTMIATQLGHAIGAIASTATGAHDVGLPILQPARSLLIPENIEKWGADTEIAKSEIYLFHALREGAIARLFEHNPWIVSYIRSAIVDYGAGIRIDLDAIQRQAEEAMQGMSSDMNPGEQSFTIALDSGIFTPEETPAQRAALEKLETVLALVDGWADDVATLAAGDRIPSITALRELHRRKRATSAPAQQLFKTMLGLEVSPKLAREASAFWGRVREVKDASARDQLWSGILPSATELLAPDLFLASTEIPDDLSGLI
jgi:putative hydrolase